MTTKNPIVAKEVILPFILITVLFSLWGFANDITNPLVAAFKTVFEITNAQSALVQMAFYGGYFTMAIPAALFATRYSYKNGILLGLALYATGAFLFYPAAHYEIFGLHLIALYILTFGLAFLETTANPYILSMGSPETATRRLNLAQSFNPIGSITGMFVASHFILSVLQSDIRDESGNIIFNTLSVAEKAVIKTNDLAIIRNPYLLLGIVVMIIFIIIAIAKMPKYEQTSSNVHFIASLKRLVKNVRYKEGVIAQMFYVGAQIMCWTFIIQYADNLGIKKSTAQNYNMIAMGIFIFSRFLSTILLKYINRGMLLFVFALGGLTAISGVILINGMTGLYCLIATSFFMSLMFPTIYAIALDGLGEDAKLGAAGLVMAIVGGAIMPIAQGWIIDKNVLLGMPAVNISFIITWICFVVIAMYGYRTKFIYHK
jgi:MFS transporter, FHS family, L-fucose permease